MFNFFASKKGEVLGHLDIIEFVDCKTLTDSPLELEKQMIHAAKLMEATVVDSVFHKFNPYGLSGVIVLAESHFAIHTWPEHNYAAIDLFTCGKIDSKKGIDYLKEVFSPKKIQIKKLVRGLIN